MPKTIETGKKGEEQAIAFLKKNGYEILETNWRYKKLEIDIIAKKDDFLVIIEVKTRKNDVFGAPEVFVTKPKQSKIIRATHQFILQSALEYEVRFDIVAINNQNGQIEHIERAFYPDLL